MAERADSSASVSEGVGSAASFRITRTDARFAATVDYTITVENTGGIPLFKQSIVDTLLGDLTDGNNPLITFSDCGISLDPGESCTIEVTRTVDAGDPDPLPNTVTVTYNSNAGLTGDEVTREDSHEVDLFQPSVVVTKTGDELSKVGDDVTYTFTVENTSSLDSPDLILDSFTDTLLGDLTADAGYDDDCDQLAPGDTCSFDVTRTVQVGDPDPLVNTVTVHYHPDGFENDITDFDDHSVNLFQPSVTIDKTGDTLSKVGDDVKYTITVANTSSSDSPDLVCDISDALLGINQTDVSIAPGEDHVINPTYTVQAGDPDPLVNTASVTCGVDGFPNVLGPFTDTHSVNLFQPDVEVIKTGPASATVGDTVTYNFTINNLSSADSPNLILDSVTDTVLGDLTATAAAGGCTSLASSGSCNFTADHTVVFPRPYTEFSSGRVLTMQMFSGTSVGRVETLKRRGQRRLVGAVALVLAAVVVLPMVFDPEPRGTAPAVNVRIPGEDETPFTPKPPAKKLQPVEQYVVQVGAFTSPQAAIAKLESAKVPYYTEAMQGNLTRVRAGPFATREAAEKALEQLKGLGFEPGAVSAKSG